MTYTDKIQLPAQRRTGRAPNRRYVTGSGGGSTPYMLNEAGLSLIQRLSSDGLQLVSIAEAVGLSKDTFIELRRRQPEAQECIDRGRSRVVGELTNVLIEKARKGDTVALLFALKTIGGFREGVPVEGASPAVQVNITIPEPLAPEQVMKIIGQEPKP
ncbi:MAG: hypothetical protein ACT4OU_00320 [Hyphomicrobium sp.]